MKKNINDVRQLIKEYEYDVGIAELNNQYSVATPNVHLPYPLSDFINNYFNVQHNGNSLMVFTERK